MLAYKDVVAFSSRYLLPIFHYARKSENISCFPKYVQSN